MDNEEELYRIVVEEIERGDIRKGLWGKALSEEENDHDRAKAKYIELRVNTLCNERKEIVNSEKQKDQQGESYQAQQDYIDRVNDIESRLYNIKKLQQIRTEVRILGFILPFIFITIMSYFALSQFETFPEKLLVSVSFSFFAGTTGFLLVEIYRWCTLSQHDLEQEEKNIEIEKNKINKKIIGN